MTVPARTAPPPTVLIRGELRDPVDGCGARRHHDLEAQSVPHRIVILPVADPADSLAKRMGCHVESISQVIREALSVDGDLILYYPEVPFFFPPSVYKLIPGLLIFWVIRCVMSLRGRHMVIDIVDINRWQFPSLNRALSSRARVSRIWEWCLFRLVDRIRIPGCHLADWLRRDLNLAPNLFDIRPHQPPRISFSGEDKPRPQTGSPAGEPHRVRFVYVGGLDQGGDRGVSWLIRCFLRADPLWAELILAGQAGEWITQQVAHPRVNYKGLLGERELIELVRSCDYGIIPYPEWGYYKTVLPAKLSFYEGCGISVISTRIPEAVDWFARGGKGGIIPYLELSRIFRSVSSLPST